MRLASLLKHLRTAAGLTQEELAEKAEVSARTISDVERGLRTRIYRDTAGRIADALALEGASRREFEQSARGRIKVAKASPAIPAPATALIGRAREIELVLAALDRPDIRLLTMTGPGGIGKTRIALEAAQSLSDAAFVQLGNVVDPELVVAEIARSTGLPATEAPTAHAVGAHLDVTVKTLILDTFEHVIAAAPDVAALMAAAPRLTVLVTSREPLRVRGEHEIAISALELPITPTREEAERAPATMLFLERARAVDSGFTLDAQNAELVADICRKVDAIPLAIELAAARVRHFSLQTLRDRLDNSLRVLTGGPRDLPRRQQTMRDTVAWSYDLLDQHEQAVFRDLSVFAGGWTLEAAEAVCAGNDVGDMLGALVDKSLVDRSGDRYGLLDVIREFSTSLSPPDQASDRHTAYFLALCERAEPELGREAQDGWLRRIAEETPNIRAAIRRTLHAGDTNTALRICGAVWRYWLVLSDLTEARTLIATALEEGTNADARLRAKALWGLAWLSFHHGDLDALEACANEMLLLPDMTAVNRRNGLTIQAMALLARLRFADAIPLLEECIELVRDQDDWLRATSVLNLGMALCHAGDGNRAAALLADATAEYRRIGDHHYAARAQLYRGYTCLLRGDLDEARAVFGEVLTTFWELDDQWGIAEGLEGCATSEAAGGRPERAATLAAVAERLRDSIGARALPADRAVLERELGNARDQVDGDRWSAARQSGLGMALEAAIAFALEDRSE